MEHEGGIKLGKKLKEGEVDYKTTSGTAWSHSYLNQKPWHPLSYPNQRRKWIAEQTHAQRDRRAEEVAREFSQEQEFFRQTALISKKEKEKAEMMQAVSFMYLRPPGYNAESAKAAEIADEQKMIEQNDANNNTLNTDPSTTEQKKPRPKDVFGRLLPTEQEFELLKNAPRLDTGVAGRVKPFGVEIRNVKCLRCGVYGHQSGDRECLMKDAIMPNEEMRLKRDDPLNAMLAGTSSDGPPKWELKQRPGMSPPRGGFEADDPNQQIIAEDIFDEYGGFLSGGIIPELLSRPITKKSSKRSRSRQYNGYSDVSSGSGSSDRDGQRRKREDKKFQEDGNRKKKEKRGRETFDSRGKLRKDDRRKRYERSPSFGSRSSGDFDRDKQAKFDHRNDYHRCRHHHDRRRRRRHHS